MRAPESLPVFGDHAACEVRTSSRARHARIEIFYPCRVRVTVPRGYPQQDIAGLIESKRFWIEGVLRRFAKQRRPEPAGSGDMLPACFELAACGETWKLHQQPGAGKRLRLIEGEGCDLYLRGPLLPGGAFRAPLLRWLAAKARRDLIPALRKAAAETELEYSGAAVRFQRTRWGSCSARRTISLNVKLLFLPPHLVRYILIHELCHTRHLDHSRRFWELVLRHDPQCHEHRRQMRTAARFVPDWAA